MKLLFIQLHYHSSVIIMEYQIKNGRSWFLKHVLLFNEMTGYQLIVSCFCFFVWLFVCFLSPSESLSVLTHAAMNFVAGCFLSLLLWILWLNLGYLERIILVFGFSYVLSRYIFLLFCHNGLRRRYNFCCLYGCVRSTHKTPPQR